MFRYDKQIEAILKGQSRVSLRLRFGHALGYFRNMNTIIFYIAAITAR